MCSQEVSKPDYYSEEDTKALAENTIVGLQFKSLEQGAATMVWGAISKSPEGIGGKYLEHVQIARKGKLDYGHWAPEYTPHAYSLVKEAKLWEMSLKLVGEKSSMMQ